jgi:hypothetical protein
MPILALRMLGIEAHVTVFRYPRLAVLGSLGLNLVTG